MITRVVIQSRLSSSRLPGKALLSVAGMPMIELVARRASRSGFEVVVATSEEDYDERIAHHLEAAGVPVVRGSLDDVLGRFAMATSDLAEHDRVVRLTGDNPLVDADLVQELMDSMDSAGHEYGRVDIDVVPEGLGVEVFSVALLRAADAAATRPYDREHVTPWIRRHTTELLFAPTLNPGNPAVYRATVDCLQDYFRISRLFDDVSDPVGIPWFDLMDRLVSNVASLGAVARPVASVKKRLTAVVLGASRAGLRTGERDASAVRAVFSQAVDCAVSDVVCDATEGPILAAGMLPGLKQRMGIILLLPSLGSHPCPGSQLEALIERVMSQSGSPRLRAVLVHNDDLFPEDSGRTESVGAELFDTLNGYVSRGVVDEMGVFLAPGHTIDPEGFPDVALVASDVREQGDLSVLAPWKTANITTLAMLRSDARQLDARQLLVNAVGSAEADAVTVSPHDREELAAQLALAHGVTGARR